MKYGASGSLGIVPEHSGCPALEGLMSAEVEWAHG